MLNSSFTKCTFFKNAKEVCPSSVNVGSKEKGIMLCAHITLVYQEDIKYHINLLKKHISSRWVSIIPSTSIGWIENRMRTTLKRRNWG